MSKKVTTTERLRQENSDLKKRLAEQTKLLETQAEAIRKSRSKIKIPTRKPRTVKGSFVRFVIPDTHGYHVDPIAVRSCLADMELLNPSEIVWLGDHLDCGGFLAQHHTLGYVAEMEVGFSEDRDATNLLLDRVQQLAPKATHHFLMGNHERRIEKWCVTQSLGNRKNAEFLRELFCAENVLHLEKRKFNYYRQGECYMGLPIPATIKLGHCHFTHGSRTGVHAAKAMLHDFGGCVVYGHTHRADSFLTRSVSSGTIASYCPGFLAKYQPYWMHTQITGWTHGYGLQFVDPDGTFLHLNVPIIEGRSLLLQLLSILKVS